MVQVKLSRLCVLTAPDEDDRNINPNVFAVRTGEDAAPTKFALGVVCLCVSGRASASLCTSFSAASIFFLLLSAKTFSQKF